MNCPNCLSIMYNSTAIISMADGSRRMDLHCHNPNCPSTEIPYKPHVGVFVRPNDMWLCYSYHIPYYYRDKWYSLKGIWHDPEWLNVGSTQINQIGQASEWVAIKGGGAYNKKGLTLITSLIDVEFIPISTGDDMHVEANKLFTRLMNLVIFS